MSGPGAILREIHRLQKNARDLQARLEQGPRQLKLQQDRLARQEQGLKSDQDEVKQLKVHIHDKEVSLKALDEQIKKYERQMSGIISKKEFDAFKHELAHARGEVARLEDEILAILVQVEEKAARLPESEKALKEARAQTEQFVREYEDRMANLAAQHKEVLAKLAQVAATLPDDVKPQYERLTRHKGEDALSAVESRICTACYTEITAQNFNDLVRGVFVQCKNCGRMLYLAEGTGD
jgi:predicted  nucleic acid-binding Zn-ribbon protein